MSDELRRTYPIFSAKLLNRPHPKSSKSIKQYLVISGGGGKAASGIHNKLELFDISGSRVPKQICDVFTDDCGKGFPEDKNDIKRNNAPMNMSIYNDKFIAVGVGEKTQIYEITSPTPTQDIPTTTTGRIRKRNTETADKNNKNNSDMKIKRVAELVDESLDTDTAPVTRVALAGGSQLITGGTNTSLKVYSYSRSEEGGKEGIEVSLKYEIPNSHKKELRDLSVHKNLIATTSEDKNCYIWSLSSNSFKKIWSLKEQFLFYHKIKNNVAYKFTGVNWYDTGRENSPAYLITCHSPVLSRTTEPSYVCLWRYNEQGQGRPQNTSTQPSQASLANEKFQLVNSKSLFNEVGVCKIASKSMFIDTHRQILGLGLESGHVLVYSVPDFTPIFRHEPKDLKQASIVTNVVISRKFVVTTSMDMCIRVYDFKSNYNQFWEMNKSFIVLSLIFILVVVLRVVLL